MIWSRLALLMATPHLDPLPFTKGRGGRSPVDPKLTINEHYLALAVARFKAEIQPARDALRGHPVLHSVLHALRLFRGNHADHPSPRKTSRGSQAPCRR